VKKHSTKGKGHGVQIAAALDKLPGTMPGTGRLRAGGKWIGNRELRILATEENGIIFYTSGTYGITIA